MMAGLCADLAVVMTLDAGGTSFRFSAMRARQAVTETIVLPSFGDDLPRCLETLVEGFTRIRQKCPTAPVAISFAFPAPADYEHGIIGDLANLPAFRGGVALGPMLEERFGVPVFINNDGDLFAYGEAIAGLLPWVNDRLARAGSPKRFHNLVGVTLGTGFGGGIVREGRLFVGDNSMAGEIWLVRNKLDPAMNAEEGASIRAVRREYARRAGIPFETAPDPRQICAIGLGHTPGHRPAAIAAFDRLGEIAGDALAQALTLVDGLAVIGGGLSGAAPLFMPRLVAEINGTYSTPSGGTIRRLASRAFHLDDPSELEEFLCGDVREIKVPGTTRTVCYDPLQRVGVGLSRLGTSEAVAIGAYAFATQRLGYDQ